MEKSWRPPAAKKYLRLKKYPRLKKDLRLEIGLYLEEHLQKPAADKPVLAGGPSLSGAIRPESKSCCRIRLQLRVVMLSHWERDAAVMTVSSSIWNSPTIFNRLLSLMPLI